MSGARALLLVAALLAGAPLALAETVQTENGGDTFLSGSVLQEVLDSSGETFISGQTVVARGASAGDMHVAGFDVTVSADAAEDLYAAGGTVVVQGSVAEDLTVAGFSVRTDAGAVTGRNVRLIGNNVTVEGPVSGALTVTAREIVLNAPVSGDVRLLAQTISFGPEARVDGTFSYSSPERIAVPERVVSEDRVVFERLTARDAWDEWDAVRREMPILPTFASMFFGFVVSLLFFLALGAVVLGFMPKRLSRMRKTIADQPGETFLLGILGLSILFGMVPIIGFTIVGLPFVPIAILCIIVAWTLGYALGAYSVAMRVWVGFRPDQELGKVGRLLVLAAAITSVALLNFIPFVGWVVNYALVLLGIGAMTRVVFNSVLGNHGQAFDIDMKPTED